MIFNKIIQHQYEEKITHQIHYRHSTYTCTLNLLNNTYLIHLNKILITSSSSRQVTSGVEDFALTNLACLKLRKSTQIVYLELKALSIKTDKRLV